MDENMQNNNGMPQQEKKGLAIASMVLGITSIVPGWCIPYFPFILGLIGVILGGVSLSKKTRWKRYGYCRISYKYNFISNLLNYINRNWCISFCYYE